MFSKIVIKYNKAFKWGLFCKKSVGIYQCIQEMTLYTGQLALYAVHEPYRGGSILFHSTTIVPPRNKIVPPHYRHTTATTPFLFVLPPFI